MERINRDTGGSTLSWEKKERKKDSNEGTKNGVKKSWIYSKWRQGIFSCVVRSTTWNTPREIEEDLSHRNSGGNWLPKRKPKVTCFIFFFFFFFFFFKVNWMTFTCASKLQNLSLNNGKTSGLQLRSFSCSRNLEQTDDLFPNAVFLNCNNCRMKK